MPRGKGPSGPGAKLPKLRGTTKFGVSRVAGLKLEYDFRRGYPLSSSDIEQLAAAIREALGKHRRKYKWFFVSLRLKVLGALYKVRLSEGEEPQWEEQWVSTHVMRSLRELDGELKRLDEEVLEANIQGRPARLLGFRIAMFRNR